ncbi:MAG: hypothetical protein HUJ95_00855, partial [Bacteroidales bacterium]|nr:hypothetical protein [Bacteroidales bacterium]
MKKGIIYIILAFAAAVSCGSEAVEQQPSTFADTITPADSTQYSAVLRGYSRSRKGSVALIGESDRTRALALNIMNYDRFENTKGTYEKDFL